MGQILAEALEKGALSFEDKIQILTKILAALQHAHGRDVVHADVKPSNIYLCGDGTIKLMDVGLARVPTVDTLASGNVLGIPYYASPEQLKGETVDRRTDIYSTGVMAYEMLSGRRPFEPDDETIPSVISQVISEAPKPMDTDLSRTLPEIEAIVSKAMAKSPDERYQSAGEMQKALTIFLNSSQARLTAIEIAAAPLTFGTPTQLDGTAPQPRSPGVEALAKAANWWFAGGVAAAAVIAVILLGRPGAEMKNAGVPGGRVAVPAAAAPTPSPVFAPRATLSPAPLASAVAATSKSVPAKKSTTGSLPVSGAVAIGAPPKPVEITAVARELGSKALSNETDRSAAARELRVPLGVRMANAIAISGNESAKELQKKIDSGDTYTVDARAVTRFVSRYLEDKLTAQQLEEIGDLLEGGEFLEYVGPGSDGVIAQVVYEFSTPAPNRPITKEAAERWLGLLAG